MRLRREISGLAYAPALHAVGDDCDWYSEELLHGDTGHNFAPREQSDFIAIYHATIEPLLVTLLRQQPLENRFVAPYLEALDAAVAAPLATLRDNDPDIADKIQQL
ncbi:MAG: hypothetical protein GTO41_23575, partial [Burkholderiales bacterium]|nr:hypothetical protein [Burkholderiales bacterium]